MPEPRPAERPLSPARAQMDAQKQDAESHDKVLTGASSSGGPPRHPPGTAREMGEDSPDNNSIRIPDPISIRNLAKALNRKPFKIISDAMEFGYFQSIQSEIPFELAKRIAQKHGVTAYLAS